MTSAERRQSSGLTMESLSRSLNDVLRSAPLGIFRAHLVHANIWTSRTNTDYNLSFGATASLTMSNDENNLGNVIGGTFFGALAGGGLGLGACMFLFDDPPFFTGDTILIGAIACGVLGYFLGAGFIEWLKENWWGFWS